MMKFTREQYFRIWLAAVEGIGARRFSALIDRYGSAEAVWEGFGESMRWIGDIPWQAISNAHSRDYAAQMVERIAKAGAEVLFLDDPGYPKMLRELSDPPPLLYVKGRADLSDETCIAIVGTRNASDYGVRMTRSIAGELAQSGAAIISGFARGIDTAAHTAALDAGGRTVAVFACGVDFVYPPENGALYERMLRSGGSIISEYPPGATPMSGRFPARNRLISGISRGTLVVEGLWRSGAKITAGTAIDQGREVFVLPGPVDSPLSELPNRLAREGARIVTSAADILDDLNLVIMKPSEVPGANPSSPKKTKKVKKKITSPETSAAHEAPTPPPINTSAAPAMRQLDAEESLVYEAYSTGIIDVDDLVGHTGLAVSTVNTVLTMLSIEGIIQ